MNKESQNYENMNKIGMNKDGYQERSIKNSIRKALMSFGSSLPMIMGILLLIGLFRTYVTTEMISSVFTGNLFSDTFFGAGVGSIAAGSPITGYIIGGELLKENVSLFAVTAFMVAWVTVGVVQLPAEIKILGKRFAILRNLLSFVFSIFISLATVFTLEVLR